MGRKLPDLEIFLPFSSLVTMDQSLAGRGKDIGNHFIPWTRSYYSNKHYIQCFTIRIHYHTNSYSSPVKQIIITVPKLQMEKLRLRDHGLWSLSDEFRDLNSEFYKFHFIVSQLSYCTISQAYACVCYRIQQSTCILF